jgi:hypothetical protein
MSSMTQFVDYVKISVIIVLDRAYSQKSKESALLHLILRIFFELKTNSLSLTWSVCKQIYEWVPYMTSEEVLCFPSPPKECKKFVSIPFF